MTGATLPRQQKVFKARQARVTWQAVRLCEPAVEGEPVSSETYLGFLRQLYFNLPAPREDLWCHSSWTSVIQSSAQKMRHN